MVPLFNEQIKAGGPVTVTHPEVIRYFMTIPEAAQLVIQAGSMAEGGDVFVLDMGKPVRIGDLARRMIHLMGLTVRDEQHPDGDIEISYTGLRPAEKLYEELLIGNNVTGTRAPDDPARHRAFPALGARASDVERDPGGDGPIRLPARAAAIERCRGRIQAGARTARSGLGAPEPRMPTDDRKVTSLKPRRVVRITGPEHTGPDRHRASLSRRG